MYTLYFSPGACSMASHIILEEAGADYETKLISLPKGEQRTEAYLKINPHGKVPSLDIDGKIVTENAAILPLLSREFPQSNLLPGDSMEQARCMEILGWFGTTVHAAYRPAGRPERLAGSTDVGEAALDAIRQTGRDAFWAGLEEIDAMLEGKEFVMGSQFTLVDPYALVFYGWGINLDMPMGDLKNYTAFKDRMLQRPGVRKVLEDEQSVILKTA